MDPYRYLTGTVIPVSDHDALARVPTMHLPVMDEHFADTVRHMDPEQAARLSRYERDGYYS